MLLIRADDLAKNCAEVYNYDNRGNFLTVSKSGVLFQQYVYDEASQVKAEYNYAEHTAMTYVYDSNGNIVSKTPYTNVTSSDLLTATQGTAIVAISTTLKQNFTTSAPVTMTPKSVASSMRMIRHFSDMIVRRLV